MAKFNNEMITDNKELRQKAMEQCGMFLQSCLTNEEIDRLKADWNAVGGFKVIPWWKFAFDNITVSYNSNAERK